ncbi:MAG TPA: hypothetical protein PK055_01035 [Gammaproteobacteria bacterium]|nr:hypothetical protein [Xanthomonadales bacterium]MCB1604213.1 hypothetical protein [Xanthomonadales bacterium]HOP21820.1 hypothetical protein [Gammaproteobacteria bacterium]HPI94953.1 hypothetical protein [Gammaproteobacteria bacterium]HPQ86219.1 hypothetical protein [Gammaproteobacteria bacterium]
MLFSISTSQAACVNDPQSTQPIATDSSSLSSSSLSADSEKEDESLNCTTLPTVTVIGYLIKNPWQPFSFFLSWALDTHVTGGTNTGVQIPQNYGCGNGDVDGRISQATTVFIAERTASGSIGAIQFVAYYQNGLHGYPVSWPDGSTGIYNVGAGDSSSPITHEISCE